MGYLNKRRFFVFLLVSVLWGGGVMAQQDTSIVKVAKNSFFVEYGGNAVGEFSTSVPEAFSINYDRILTARKFVKTSARIGCNIPIDYKYHDNIFIIPMMLNLLFGKQHFYFELGLGGELIYIQNYNNHYSQKGAFTSVFGIRYQNNKKRIMARIGLTPTLGAFGGYFYWGIPFGISIGYNF